MALCARLAAQRGRCAARCAGAERRRDRGSARPGRRRDRSRRSRRRPGSADRPWPRTTISRWPTTRSTATPIASAPAPTTKHVQRAARPLRDAEQAASRTIGSTPPRNGTISCPSIRRTAAGSISITSRTRGSAAPRSVWSPTCAISASVIASVSGSSIAKRVPCAGDVCQRHRAAQLLAPRCWTTAMPTPRPLARSASSRVEKPGRAQDVEQPRLVERPVGHRKPSGRRPRRHRRRVDPAAVVGDLEHDRVADAGRAEQSRRAGFGLAGGQPLGSAVSMPWLTALRTRCSTGSIIRSIRNLSISVSWPAQLERDPACPVSRARSRTTNGIRRKISPTGTSRTRITPSRRSRSWRSIGCVFSWIGPPLGRRDAPLDAARARRRGAPG